ncbi:probable ATP-dependent RNA helicase DHX34 isoform X1 [Nematostella vectensis]|uniref:probable ATP-dependent RNA helicase DHX34 isoform X1 n=1 Tax=Nematostella vectensis TaxID=45351 RepID=UPI002077631D|nr:probable ATP-dependent RNA helicase DHX34 isoform X1 [Nematostella vectensis]
MSKHSHSKRRHGRYKDDSSDEDDSPIDWSEHKHTLDHLFFRDNDYIKRGTEDYKDFWHFFERYESFQRKRSLSKKDVKKEPSNNVSQKLGLPVNYDKRYRVNVSVLSGDIAELVRPSHHKGKLKEKEPKYRGLTEANIAEFRSVLLYYIDFCQKQKFNKLAKLKRDQTNLPISQFRQQIVDAVKNHQVVIIAGDTGCGKSTQVPQYLLHAGFTEIACTQPRRIACISLAKRVGFETLNEYGSEVAYQIRFEGSKTSATRILFLTEGLLLRQIASDPDLSRYNVVVVDEVHERHLHGDFLLGMLRCIIEGRANLKLVLMSATINIDLFAGYFEGAPVIQVPGRLYPIQVQYQAPAAEKQKAPTSRTERLDPSPYLKIMQLIDYKYPPTERGDLLIFLSGMSEISAVVDAAREYAQRTRRWIVLPLHSSLSVDEQDKVFDVAPDGVRKCIVSTNIAETSITIDGIRFIADSGKVKEMSFDNEAKMQRLQEFWISQASAEQRKGRAGRTGPGVCYRLYTQSDYHAFSEYATPEIQRAPLDSTVLQMVAMGINDVRAFPFIEPPPRSSIENSVHFLQQQGALTEDEAITPVGQMLSRLPVDVVIGKMLLMGSVFHVTDPVMIIAAGLSVQSPWTRRLDHDPDVMALRKELESDHGDPFTLLNAYDEWIQVKSRQGSGSKKWCRRRGLEEQRFYEMSKLKRQFEDLLVDHGLIQRETKDDSDDDEREREKYKRRQLKRLKREHQTSTRRRKLLKLEEDEEGVDDKETVPDIRDMEFKLTHDLDKLEEERNTRRGFTLRDINLLKIILCSGLYPNLAIADDTNCWKRDTEQTFHTQSKSSLLLHPTSVFATNPDVLKPPQDIGAPPSQEDVKSGKRLRDSLDLTYSTSHQLLAYVSLLETNKPYLVNSMRVPGLQTLMLFARSLDTNADLTRVIADTWLEVRLPDAKTAQSAMSAVIQLRSTWMRLLQLRLDAKRSGSETGLLEMNKCRDLERALAKKLSEFLDSNIRFSTRRLLPSEDQHLYKGLMDSDDFDLTAEGILPFQGPSTPLEVHPTKGGIRVNEYLTYNCLMDEIQAEAASAAAEYIQKHWTCPKCGEKMIITVLERLRHENDCHETEGQESIATQESQDTKPSEFSKPDMAHLRREYFCADCKKEFVFTSSEILKHKRSHR